MSKRRAQTSCETMSGSEDGLVRTASRASSATSTSTRSRRSAGPRPAAALPTPSHSTSSIEGCKVLAVLSISDSDGPEAVAARVRRDSFILLSPTDSSLPTRDLWKTIIQQNPSDNPRVWMWELRELVANFKADTSCSEVVIREVSVSKTAAPAAFHSSKKRKPNFRKSSSHHTHLVLNAITDVAQVYAAFDGWPNLYVALETHQAPSRIKAEEVRGISSGGLQRFPSVHALSWQSPVRLGLCEETAAHAQKDAHSILVGSAIVDKTNALSHRCVIDVWLSRLDGVMAWPNRYARVSSEHGKHKKKSADEHVPPPATPPPPSSEISMSNLMLCA